jgi:succinyl-diaminopimelate desuccinylase
LADPVPLLKDLIRCASVTPASNGVLDVVEAALTPLGFAVTRLTFEGDGSYPVENLFATRGSANGGHLLFAGHTDVVPPGDAALWSHSPFSADEANGVIFGRGAVDMKSGVAAFIAAIGAAGETTGKISLAITNDEEADAVNGTVKLLEWAHQQGHRFDFAIVGEPSSVARVGDSLKIGRRGSLNGRIVVMGTQGHVAYPDKANNPMPVIAALVTELSQSGLDAGTEHFPPSNLEVTSVDVGNETTNVIPAKGSIRFNIRFNDRWTPETLRNWLGERIAAVDAHGCQLELSVLGTPSRSFLSPTSGAVAALCDVARTVTGLSPALSTAGGTSDARFVAQYCPVVELGLVGTTMHQADERVAVADLHALTRLYADIIVDFFMAER